MPTRAQLELRRKYPTCASIPFVYVAFFFENFAAAQKPAQRKRHLKSFREHYVNRDADDIFQLYRLLLPHSDRLRGSYGLREGKLAAALVDACGLSRNSDEAKDALKWQQRSVARSRGFAAAMQELLFDKCCGKEDGTLPSAEYTVGDVNRDLDRLATERGKEQRHVLQDMVVKTTAKQMKWITLIILNGLGIGLSDAWVLSDFHQDAGKLYDATMDLQKVCTLLKDPAVRHQIKDIEPGVPARPQLAKRKDSLKALHTAMRQRPFVVEVKFDGERSQLHKRGDVFMYYSRNGIDHGERASFGIFNAVARRQILPDNCILDGELVVWNRSASLKLDICLRPTVKVAVEGRREADAVEYEDFREEFAEDKKVHRLPALDQLQFLYIAFDILFVENRSVTALPLSERHKLLRTAIKDAPMDGIVMGNDLKGAIIPLLPDATFLGMHCLSKQGSTPDDIAELFNHAVTMQEEGVVVKALDSPWTMNDKSENWLKMKPDYIMNHEVDALVIGGYYGKGNQTGIVSEFLLGTLDTSERERKYVSFCKVGTGLSEKEREIVENVALPHMKKLKKAPKYYRVTSHHRETPDEWIINPRGSVVLQIKADIRLVPSDVFGTGYTLRFPRVTRVRTDKDCEDVMTVQELGELVQHHSGNLSKRKRQMDASVTSPGGRKRLLSVAPQFVRTPAKRRGDGTVLDGLVVCFTDYGNLGKEFLETLVQELGAELHMNPTRACQFLLGCDPNDQYLRMIIDRGKYQVVSVDWLLKCDEDRCRCPLMPRDYICRSTMAARKLTSLLEGEDPYLDLRQEDIEQVVEHHLNQRTLKMAHDDIFKAVEVCPEIDMEMSFPGSTVLAGCKVYPLPLDEDPGPLAPSGSASDENSNICEGWRRLRRQCDQLKVEWKVTKAGGEMTHVLMETVTHIVFSDAWDRALQTPDDFLDQLAQQKVPSIDFHWLQRSLEERKLHLIKQSWVLELEDVKLLRDGFRVLEGEPHFVQMTAGPHPAFYSVASWPWAEYTSRMEIDLPSDPENLMPMQPSHGRSKRQSTPRVSQVSRRTLRTSSPASPTRKPRCRKGTTTPPPKKLKKDGREKAKLEETPGPKKRQKKQQTLFDCILGEETTDQMEVSDDGGNEVMDSSVQSGRRAVVASTPEAVRTRSRSRSPPPLPAPTSSRKTGKTSVAERLRTLRRR